MRFLFNAFYDLNQVLALPGANIRIISICSKFFREKLLDEMDKKAGGCV